MSRDKPVLRAIKLLSLVERNANGLRVADMAAQLEAPPRPVYRDLQVLEELRVPLYTDKNGRESFWKVDPEYRNRLAIPFTLSELLSLYFAQDSIRPLDGTILHDSLLSLFDKVRATLPKPLFRQMLDLRGSFLSGIPAPKGLRDAYNKGNVIRGGFGSTFRRIVCHANCREPETCEPRKMMGKKGTG
jgi:predicted DNA-binding transcriptional regulator YafY